MLYLIATPIGNLKDISVRAIETLQASDYILCEDTRRSLILLNHYQIRKPLHSFHKFNEAFKENNIVQDLKEGKVICLISDAGTPGISDPGERLVKRCVEEGINVSTVPGACAAIAALSISGLETNRFQFYGFLPKQKGALKSALEDILTYPHTSICYESPERIEKVLKVIQSLDAERSIVLCRELTKKFEEVLRGTATELLNICANKTLKGELVLLFAGQKHVIADWEDLSIEEHLVKVQGDSLSLKEAIKEVAKLRGIPKRAVYEIAHKYSD